MDRVGAGKDRIYFFRGTDGRFWVRDGAFWGKEAQYIRRLDTHAESDTEFRKAALALAKVALADKFMPPVKKG